MEKVPLQLYLDPAVKSALSDQAYAARTTIAEYCRQVLEQHLAGITETRTVEIPPPDPKSPWLMRINVAPHPRLPKAAKKQIADKPEDDQS